MMDEVGEVEIVTMQSVTALVRKKDEIEKKIEEYGEVLVSQKNVLMDAPLVDGEGFPRADIDVFEVRQARHAIICLQNDHKKLMKDIENALHTLHAQERKNFMDKEPRTSCSPSVEKPFAKVDLVSSGSPADLAGLKVGDRIVTFGSVTSQNFKDLSSIGAVVKHSIGKSIRVMAIRQNDTICLELTPRPWNGKGLLGCNIIPLDT